MLRRLMEKFFLTRIGTACVSGFSTLTQYRIFAPRTVRLMRMDIMRLRARRNGYRAGAQDLPTKLHLGCGRRKIDGWLNVDVAEADQVIDLACASLPWPDNHFRSIVSQHVIEHLELESELLPLLRELHRVAASDCDVWLSCPDLATICCAYAKDRGRGLIEDRKTRPHGEIGMDDVPSQHMINKIFHQSGEHKNLYDFELVEWALQKAGFKECKKASEPELLSRFPEFPPRNDDFITLYVCASI